MSVLALSPRTCAIAVISVSRSSSARALSAAIRSIGSPRPARWLNIARVRPWCAACSAMAAKSSAGTWFALFLGVGGAELEVRFGIWSSSGFTHKMIVGGSDTKARSRNARQIWSSSDATACPPGKPRGITGSDSDDASIGHYRSPGSIGSLAWDLNGSRSVISQPKDRWGFGSADRAGLVFVA